MSVSFAFLTHATQNKTFPQVGANANGFPTTFAQQGAAESRGLNIHEYMTFLTPLSRLKHSVEAILTVVTDVHDPVGCSFRNLRFDYLLVQCMPISLWKREAESKVRGCGRALDLPGIHKVAAKLGDNFLPH